MPFQTISERAFDGLNNLKRLNLENNRLKMLERGLFAAKPALTYLNLMRNSLETVTMQTIQPLMHNLVNDTSTGTSLMIKGNFSFSSFYFLGSSIKLRPRRFISVWMFHKPRGQNEKNPLCDAFCAPKFWLFLYSKSWSSKWKALVL